jgi:hypothetical protein
MLWVEYPTPHGKKLCLANAALYLRLQNLQSIPVVLTNYTVEVDPGSKGNWVQLTPLDTRTGRIFAYADENKPTAGRVRETGGFDFNASEHSIAPFEIVKGWALLEYPKTPPIRDPEIFRFTFTDTRGKNFSSVVDLGPERSRNLSNAELDIVGQEDVSSVTKGYCTDLGLAPIPR